MPLLMTGMLQLLFYAVVVVVAFSLLTPLKNYFPA